MKVVFIITIVISVLGPAVRAGIKAEASKEVKLGAYTLKGDNLSDPSGKSVATLKEFNGSDKVATAGRHIIWISRTPVPKEQSEPQRNGQIRVLNLDSKLEKVIGSGEVGQFSVSKDENLIIYNQDDLLKSFEISSGKQMQIAKIKDGWPDVGFTHLGWSNDGKKFWFGEGDFEGWSLALYENSKVTELKYSSGDEYAFNPSYGWFVKSNAPIYAHIESTEEWLKKGEQVKLKLFDVLSNREVVLAQGKSVWFSPTWKNDRVLEFEVEGKKQTITESEIRSKLK